MKSGSPIRIAQLIGLAIATGMAIAGCGPGDHSGPLAPASARPPDHDTAAWFKDEAAGRGVRFQLGFMGSRPLNIQQTAGTGVALFDYNGDGWLDIFFVGQRGHRRGEGGALLMNLGDGSFEDRTVGSGLGIPGKWHGCAVGDIDNDGRPDLLLTGFGDCRLFKNLGEGRFRDITQGSGLQSKLDLAWATSAGFSDVNRDGLLDLYIGRYVQFGPNDLQFCDYNGVRAACGPKSYDPQKGSLYINSGNGRFKDQTTRWGLDDQHGKTLGVSFGDVNDDGYPDLYLANDEVHGDLYLNEKGAGYRNVGLASGTAGDYDGQVQGGMGVDWGDYNADGRLDLFVGTFQFENHSLYHNQSGGIFEHVSSQVGLSEVTRPFVAFGSKFIDLDNDGWLDVWAANGHIQDNVEQVDQSTTYRQRMQVFRNNRGSRFEELTRPLGELRSRRIVGRGLAAGDLDNDGDEDLVITDLEGPALVIINHTPPGNNWLSIRLVGGRSNRMGLGARVTLQTPDRRLIRECQTGGSYLSASDPRIHFGLGSAERVDAEVLWPSGRLTRHRSIAPNQVLTLEEPL